MFAKVIDICLVYVLTLINFILLLSPIFILIYPFVRTSHYDLESAINAGTLFIAFTAFFISSIMIIYLIFDYIFGFNVRRFSNESFDFRSKKEYEYLEDIFTNIKAAFVGKNVKLYIKDSPEVNAYAVGSLRKNRIIITTGLLEHFGSQAQDKEEFLGALEGVIGHEMSHIVNKDFLPGLLIYINEQAVNKASNILNRVFRFTTKLLCLVPILGKIVSFLIELCYKILNTLSSLFFKIIILQMYKFLSRSISRSIEYRSDRQSAQAIGYEKLSFALCFLGLNSYSNIFSSHPSMDNRVKRISSIRKIQGRVGPDIISTISSFMAVLVIFLVNYFLADYCRVWKLPHYINYICHLVDHNVRVYVDFAVVYFEKFKEFVQIIPKLVDFVTKNSS